MNAMDMFKSQMMTMLAFKQDSSNGIIYSFIVLMFMEYFMKVLPIIGQRINSLIEIYIEKASEKVEKIGLNTRMLVEEKESKILFNRLYKAQNGGMVNHSEYECCDAILETMVNINDAKEIIFNKIYFIGHKERFQLDKNINVQMTEIGMTKEGELNHLAFEISSKKLNLTELNNYVLAKTKEYKVKKQNKLGNQLYYFDESICRLNKDSKGNVVYTTAPNQLQFTMTKFYSNKSINTIFGPEINIIKDRLDLFVNNPEWYAQKGIPYTFGVLCHGEPGCGKTSLCKVIAKSTNRHIINISLHEYTTKRQLHNLFFDETINIVTNKASGQYEQLIIPMDKRVYIIEDIDCMSDIVLDRDMKAKQLKIEEEKIAAEKKTVELKLAEMKDKKDKSKNKNGWSFSSAADDYDDSYSYVNDSNPNTSNDIQKYSGENKLDKPIKKKTDENLDDGLTLSYLLNLLDGVLETPGRIIIMTTNYPEHLDKALIRPGRVDMSICFKRCTTETLRKMFLHFYTDQITESDISQYEFPNEKFTPAEVYQIMFKHIKDYNSAIKEIVG
jgi:hypothetical protein